MGALFALWLLLNAVPVLGDCEADRIDETVRVAHVFDGDTVRLEDGRRVRFIGIDSPEIDHRGGRSEPFSRAAQRRVQALLGSEQRLSLRYGEEKQDHYGRILAHPFLLDGRNLNALLLQEGLATALVVPPNLWQQGCYRRVMAQARAAGVGIWRLASHRLTPVMALDARAASAYRWLEGRVLRVERQRNSDWLVLEGGVRLRIARDDRDYFSDMDLDELTGSVVQADGWLDGEGGTWRMRLRHPLQLLRISPR